MTSTPKRPEPLRSTRGPSPRVIHALGSLNENHMNSSMESLQADSLITVHRDTTITVPVPNGMHTLGWPHVLKRPINPETMEDLAQGKFLDILSALLDRCQATTPASIGSFVLRTAATNSFSTTSTGPWSPSFSPLPCSSFQFALRSLP